jgi:hypothetical protein
VNIPKSSDRQVVTAAIKDAPSGIQNIDVLLKDSGCVEIDWIQFE